MGWLIALAVLTVLSCIPLGASVRYDSDGPRAAVIAGPVRIQLWPMKRKKKKPKEEKPKAGEEKKQPPASREDPAPKGGSIKDFLPLVRLGLDFLGDLRRKLRVKKLTFRIVLAGDDPCDLAVNYGRAWAAVSNLLPRLEQFLVIGSRDIEVECDFAADQTAVIAGADVTITVGRACVLGLRYGIRGLRELIIFKNKRKGGAE